MSFAKIFQNIVFEEPLFLCQTGRESEQERQKMRTWTSFRTRNKAIPQKNVNI